MNRNDYPTREFFTGVFFGILFMIGLVALAVIVGLIGCAPVNYDPTQVDGSGQVLPPDEDDPGAVCLSSVGPCEWVAYCDELGASEQPACDYQADGSCRTGPVTEGLSCFPTAAGGVGFCDGKGVCAP